MNGLGSWSRRQLVGGGLLLAVFVVLAAVLPMVIAPGEQAPPKAAAPTTVQPAATPPPSPTPSPMLGPTPSPTATTSSFLVDPAVRARPLHDPPRRTYREFQSVCAVRRQTSKPPVPGLYPSGRAVSYVVLGSTSGTLAEPGRFPGGSTSCLDAGDRSTYWFPAISQGGRALTPSTVTVLYKGTVDDYTSVQAFPPGLRILAGGSSAPGPAPDQAKVSWSCTGYGGPGFPPSCPDGDRLTLRLSAPNCWDGRHLDVPGHRGHLTWSIDGRCPADHPVAIPTLLIDVIYPLRPTGTLKTASGPAEDFGFGFVAGWKPSVLAHLVKTCVNAGEQCDAQGNPA